jgi:hypothetical protein
MKNISLRTGLELLLGLALAIAVGVAWYYHGHVTQQQQIKRAAPILADPKSPIIDNFEDSSLQNHSEINADANKVPVSVLKNTVLKGDTTVKKIVNSIGVSPQQLQEVNQENVQLRIAVARLRQDSLDHSRLDYRDAHLSFYYTPADSLIHNLIYNVTLTAAKVSKGGFFNRSVRWDFYPDDPRARVMGVNHFVVTQPDPFFGLTAFGKFYYDFNSTRMIPGLGIDFQTGKFHTTGTEYWNPAAGKFTPVIAFGYVQKIF